MGANLDWLKKQYGVLVWNDADSTVATAAAVAPAAANDPDAMTLVFVNFGAFDIFLTLAQNPVASSGIRLIANGGTVSFNVRDDFTLPARQWFASSPGGASSLYVIRGRAEVLSGSSELQP